MKLLQQLTKSLFASMKSEEARRVVARWRLWMRRTLPGKTRSGSTQRRSYIAFPQPMPFDIAIS